MNVRARKPEEMSPGPTYQQVLDRDTRPVPEMLRIESAPDIGCEPVDASRYTSQAFFDKEVEKVWLKAWQMACREEDIPNPGDYQIYEVVGKSLIIVRTQTGAIKALYNSCLHRGRKLVTLEGCKQEFRCPFHGMTWALDGAFKWNPLDWDMPWATGEDFRLPEAKVGTWAGFVFISFDPDAPPLETVLHPMNAHFERWRLEDTYKFVHVAKVFPANWKAVSEAFMESHHSLTTHPQILPYLADLNSQYDVLSDHVTRHISAMGVPAPLFGKPDISEDEILGAIFGGSSRADGTGGMKVPPGMTARSFAAEMSRQAFAKEDGYDYSGAADAEMLDAILYNVFPNVSFWAGFVPNLVYRWRPVGRSPDKTVMEIIRLKRVPKGQPRPKPCQVHWLKEDESFSSAEELGPLGIIFDQDMGNLPYVQEGLHASGTGKVHFGRYSEMRLRHLHRMIDRYIAA